MVDLEWNVAKNQNGSIELTHYGILGMKWGVRRTPEQLGHKPSRSEKKQVRNLKGAYKSALKNAQARTAMADKDRKEFSKADAEYEALQKKGFGIRKSTKRQRAEDLQNAEVNLNRKMKTLEYAESNQQRAMDILTTRSKELESYVKNLTKAYGIENVKQLEMKKKGVKAGEDYRITDVYKTGVRVQDLPIIGRQIVGKQVAEWEREIRNEALDESTKKRAKSY